MIKNIVSFSGGKDSTAMLLMLLSKKEPIHSVVWFDTERDFPEIKQHISLIAQKIKIQKIRHWAGFDFLEERHGPPHRSGGWCAAAKRDCCNKYMRLAKKDNSNICECIGFSSDEKHRARKISKSWAVRFPLIEWNITSAMALKYCVAQGYNFSGIYNKMPSRRVSCYDCPKQSGADFEAINKYWPELKLRKKTS